MESLTPNQGHPEYISVFYKVKSNLLRTVVFKGLKNLAVKHLKADI